MGLQERWLNDLKNTNSAVRKKATLALWSLWYEEAGNDAASHLNRGAILIEEKKFNQAENLFIKLISDYPDFPEAHNKLATVLYLKGSYVESMKECKITLKMNPVHFGAWNGLGLCLFNLGQYSEAIKCFKKALDIQPFSKINRIYISRCLGNLN